MNEYNIGLEELEELLLSLDSLTIAKMLNDLAHVRARNTDSFRTKLYNILEYLERYSSDIDTTKAFSDDVVDYFEGRFKDAPKEKDTDGFYYFCPSCGTDVSGSLIKYCPNCGLAVINPEFIEYNQVIQAENDF